MRQRPLSALEAALFQWINGKAWVIGVGAITTNWRTLGCERHWVTREGNAQGAYFHGSVDEFCIFGKALEPHDVQRLAGAR